MTTREGGSRAALPPEPRVDPLAEAISERGFAVIDDVVADDELPGLRKEADRVLAASPTRGGVRNLLGRSPVFDQLHGVSRLVERLLGSDAVATKLTLFDKTADANWLIRWHQDLTIAVRERRDVPGFSAWSTKDGVEHVRPPVAVLERILAVRLHLDDTPAENGALRVLPGSHRMGRLNRTEIAELRRNRPEEICAVAAGGAMVMKPLLLHASGRASRPSRRRVLHFEFSSAALPGGLVWA